MTCLDDATVLGLVEGRLPAPIVANVDEHLDTCPSCRAVIAQMSRANVVERGRTIGRYVVGDLLGTGAMGRVYTAWERDLDRHVAIKLVRGSSPPARMLREAQAMARLSHPNVVAVHEVGSLDDGVFVAMELVAGETLRDWARGNHDWRARVAVLVEIARGLAAVHAAEVVHRDVKPDNIIVGRDGRTRLGDFGLARTSTASTVIDVAPVSRDPGDVRAIGSTCAAGTPAYMAPELLAGDTATIATTATDQFSFGVTAYELMCGRRPFHGRTFAELASSITDDAPPLLPGPRWLDQAIRRCLARTPSERYPSMQAVALALSSRLHHRRPIAWIATAAAIASCATWLVVRRAPDQPVRVAGATEMASVWSADTRAKLAARWTRPAAATVAASIDGWTERWIAERDAIGSTPIRDACLERRRDELAAVLGQLATTTASIDRVGDAVAALVPPDECRLASVAADPVPPPRVDGVHALTRELQALHAAISLGDARPVIARTETAVITARELGHAPTLADALSVRAEALRATSQLGAAAVAARDAIAAAERGHDDAAAASAWLERVALAVDVRALDTADELAPLASAAIDRAGAPSSLVARLVRLRGAIAYDRGDLDQARTLVADARSRYAALPGQHASELAAADSLLGSIARARGDLDEAERRHAAALDADLAHRGPDHPDVARDLHNLAGVLRLRGKLDAAEARYREALAIEVATRGPASVEVGLTHNSLALVAMARRDWSAARRELDQAITALGGHGDRALAEHNLGLVLAATGHTAALEHFAAATAIYRATLGAAPARLVDDRAPSERAVQRPVIDQPPLRASSMETRTVLPPVTAPAPPAGSAARDIGVYGASQP